MALLSLNAAENTHGHRPAGGDELDQALRGLPIGHPVTIMVHGYRYCPDTAAHDPHRHILSFSPRSDCWKAVSWPRHLHLERAGKGLGIGFGWSATGALPTVANRAFRVGDDLGRLIHKINAARPDAPVGIIAHSLGARVALRALQTAPPGAVRRLILMAGAEYRANAQRALSAPGAAQCHVLNVTSRENAIFDVMFRLGGGKTGPFDSALSAGLGHLPRVVDLRIDRADVRAALAGLGHRLRVPKTWVSHWSGYMCPGLFSVYRRMLDPRDPGFPTDLSTALHNAEDVPWGETGLSFPRMKSAYAIVTSPLRSQV